MKDLSPTNIAIELYSTLGGYSFVHNYKYEVP